MMTRTVRQLLEKRGGDVWSVGPDDTVYEALQLMMEKDIGALLVVDSDQQLVGIMTERDYARKVILKDRSSRTTRVREIMTDRVQYVTPDQTIEECMALMTGKRFRHLPVLSHGRVLGVLSIVDLVKALVEEKEFLIEQLENYITGGR